MMARTPAIVAAERAGVPFRTHEYAHDRKAESYGLEAAEKLGLDPGRVFKTLVVEVDGKLGVAVVPVAAQLDLKALGGISPLGQRKRLPVVLDASVLAHATVRVSAGRGGLELELDPRDLIRLTSAEVRPIARA